jgi:hypothetical protein
MDYKSKGNISRSCVAEEAVELSGDESHPETGSEGLSQGTQPQEGICEDRMDGIASIGSEPKGIMQKQTTVFSPSAVLNGMLVESVKQNVHPNSVEKFSTLNTHLNTHRTSKFKNNKSRLTNNNKVTRKETTGQSESAVKHIKQAERCSVSAKNSQKDDHKRKHEVIDLTGDSDLTAASTKRCRAADTVTLVRIDHVSKSTAVTQCAPHIVETSARMPDTHVIMYKSSDDRYEGSLVNNKRDGMGEMEYRNGDCYIGEWKADARCGKGKMLYMRGESLIIS